MHSPRKQLNATNLYLLCTALAHPYQNLYLSTCSMICLPETNYLPKYVKRKIRKIVNGFTECQI